MVTERRRLDVHRLLIVCVAVVSLGVFFPDTASTQEATCPKCVSQISCSLVTGSTEAVRCAVDAGGCEEEWGLCIAGDRGGHGTALKQGESRKVETRDGAVRLATVADTYFAAWTCSGEVAYLYKEDVDTGEMTEMRDPLMLARYRAPALPSDAARKEASS